MSTTSILGQRFQLRERVFSEGNQAAYFAVDQTRNEEVLVFLVPTRSKLSASADQALCAEIERGFAVAAPSLLPVLDLITTDDHRFLVMPRPEGTNAWTRITQKESAARLSVEDVHTVADDLIQAAKAAHAAGTMLGSSPRQVWIRPGGGAEVQFFWLGRSRSGTESPESSVAALESLGMEGAYFKAPELNDNYQGSPAPVDQYFIAAILYGLLTGEVPGGRLAPIRNARKDVAPLLARAIEKALSQAPAARHESLDHFRDAIYKRRPRLGLLLPIAAVLVGLWAARAVFQAGVGPSSWALSGEILQEQVERAQEVPQAAPIPQPSSEAVVRFAGHYADAAGARVAIQPDGSYEWSDASQVPPRQERGLWWSMQEAPETVVFAPVRLEPSMVSSWRAKIRDGELEFTPLGSAGPPLRLAKVAWSLGPAGESAALVRIESPLDHAQLGGQEVEIIGQVALARSEVMIGQAKVPVVGGRFTHVLSAGAQRTLHIEVVATAPDGFRSTSSLTVHFDRAPPKLDVTQSELQQVDGLWQLTVSGKASDDGPLAAVSVNDEVVELGADGTFVYVRKEPDALARPFTEVVAVDEAGRTARQVRWPNIVALRSQDLDGAVTEIRAALTAGRTDEAERLLRELRERGGLIEQIPPEEFGRLVRSSHSPTLQVDALPKPPAWLEHKGTREISLGGTVEWFAPTDTLFVGGRKTDVVSGRFDARIQLPAIGKNTVPITVVRGGVEVARQELELWLADAPDTFREWTGIAPTEAQRKASAEFGLPLTRQNGLGMRFVLVPPGAFLRATGDRRTFEVRLSRPYYIQTTEVSREHYTRLGGKAPPSSYKTSSGKTIPIGGAKRPALDLTREDARAYATRLSTAEGGTYRLPTEAEWEWAARAGDATGSSYWGSTISSIPEWANYADRSIRTIVDRWPDAKLDSRIDDGHPGTWDVGTGRSNAFGIRDMLGNVAEWVADGYAEYDLSAILDPSALSSGRDGVHRGGGWLQRPSEADFGTRGQLAASGHDAWLGFRLVLEAEGR